MEGPAGSAGPFASRSELVELTSLSTFTTASRSLMAVFRSTKFTLNLPSLMPGCSAPRVAILGLAGTPGLVGNW
jgi:hypothetical protein